tara:strand:+ start:5888 stop:6400 length:513 start_codon:yes stop_codon:yes gene_type:complete
MNKNDITQIVNHKSAYVPIVDSNDRFTYIELNKFEREEDIKTILNSIYEVLHDWDGAPTLQDIKDRFSVGTRVILQYYDKQIVGWWWYCPFYANDYLNKEYELPEGGVYCGNTYIIKDIAPRSTGARLYSFSIGYVLTKYDAMYSYMDNWNAAPIKLCHKCGGVTENWMR